MQIQRTLIAIAVASTLLVCAPLAFAQPQSSAASADVQAGAATSPSQMVLDNASRVLTTLEARRAEFNSDPAALADFVSSEFSQMFDREYAARLVLGSHGRGASDADIQLFADALAESLMRRYGASLLNFNTRLRVRVTGETPLRGGSMVKVSSEFLREGGPPVPVAYLMHKVDGQWKVFDVMVEGISFIQTFRNQFDGPLSRKSIAQVTADLKAGNLQAEAGSR